jgi:hypothetical protein
LLTTVAEMIRLYGVHADAVASKDANAAHHTWVAYVQYVRRYNHERGIAVVLGLPECPPSPQTLCSVDVSLLCQLQKS